jgi:hypothetical protein
LGTYTQPVSTRPGAGTQDPRSHTWGTHTGRSNAMLRNVSRGAYSLLLAFALILALLLSQPGFFGLASAQEANCRTFAETSKPVCGKFLEHWAAHGGLEQFGFPISGEFAEESELNGRTYTVQYFERSVFDLHPENQPPYDVLLAQLGTLQYKRRHGAGTAVTTPTTVTEAPTAAVTAAPPTPSPAVAPPTLWVKYRDYAVRNGVSFVVFRADITRTRIDIHYLIENETADSISMTLANADQLVADNDYNLYPPLDPHGTRSIVLRPNQNYVGSTSFLGNAYYNRAEALTYGINNIPNLGNVRVRIPMPAR